MFSIDEFIIAVFCCVDDLLKELTQGQPIRAKGFTPALADSEVLTVFLSPLAIVFPAVVEPFSVCAAGSRAVAVQGVTSGQARRTAGRLE